MPIRTPRLGALSCITLAALLGIACGDSDRLAAEPAAPPAGVQGAKPPSAELDGSALGPGFVVWESNRGGGWRIWRRDLDGSAPYALTPDEAGKAHCCAHLSADGRRLAYLALPQNQTGYPQDGAAGELRLLTFASAGDRAAGDRAPRIGRLLARKARTYFEHRAAVWRDDRTLIHIDAEGRTVSRDVETDAVTVLVDEVRPAHGWLVDRSLGFASQGNPTFSIFDQAAGRVRERPSLGGCQPYFAHHKTLGVWIAGAGGPIRAIDLGSRRQWPLVGKGDERLPVGRRYLYFPMPSRDGRRLAWAASDGAHDHETTDYDVFVAETDPETLELLGPPWQVTHHRATDRFPDVWTEPLELGRVAGEAPLRVKLSVPQTGSGLGWQWDLGDGRRADGDSVEVTYSEPGRYDTQARSGDRQQNETVLHGAVYVEPAAPPRLLEAELRPGLSAGEGGELWVRFDEAVTTKGATATLQGGIALTSAGLRDRDTVWVLRLARSLERPDRLRVSGVTDRAAVPNLLQEAGAVVTPARWPRRREGIVFLWQDGDHTNRVVDPRTGLEETTVLEPRGRAWLDRHLNAVLRGGSFVADQGTMERLFYGVKATNEVSLEMTLTAAHARTARPSAVFGFGTGGQRRNVTVAQEGDRLTLRLNTPTTGHGGDKPVVDLGKVRAGRPQHLVVSYTPGQLRAYLDGEPTVDSDAIREGFFHWQPRNLRLGAEGAGAKGSANAGDGGWSWPGTLEGVAVYNRALTEEEALENHRRYAELLAGRDGVTSAHVEAEMISRSRTPSLSEIAPYRDALAVFEYRVKKVVAGQVDADLLFVVHRVLLDGRDLPVSSQRSGHDVELRLEPFDAQPQLQQLYLSDDLEAASGRAGATLWWSDRIEP